MPVVRTEPRERTPREPAPAPKPRHQPVQPAAEAPPPTAAPATPAPPVPAPPPSLPAEVTPPVAVPDVAPAVIAAEPSRAEETVLTTETVRGAVPRLPVPLPCGDGRRDVRAMADIVHLLVPDLVGLSVVVPDPATGEVRTLAATGEDVALLDAAQYLGGAAIARRGALRARARAFGRARARPTTAGARARARVRHTDRARRDARTFVEWGFDYLK